MDERVRLKTPGWKILDFGGNPMADEEIERPGAKIMCTPLVRLDREYLFRDDLVSNESGVEDPQLPIVARV